MLVLYVRWRVMYKQPRTKCAINGGLTRLKPAVGNGDENEVVIHYVVHGLGTEYAG